MTTRGEFSHGRRGRRLAAAAALLAALGGCSTVEGLQPTIAAPSQPNVGEDPIARMSAETRYDRAVGCASTARLALAADSPEKMMDLGMEPRLAAVGAAELAATSEATAVMGEAAARDAIATGAELGVEETAVVVALEEDYQRLEGAFRGVAEPQPQIALFTITDRLQRCKSAYQAG